IVQNVRLIDRMTVAVDLSARFAGLKATSLPVDNNTMRLMIEFAAPQTEATPATPSTQTPPPTSTPPSELPPALGQPVSAIRAIAIDAGHGGDDEGVRSAGGVKEKDLALAVARRLKTVIEARLGIRVLLTRDDDRNVPVDERTAVANNNKADLFASIHANAAFRKGTAGATIYSAAFTAAAQAAAPHKPERVPSFGGGLRDIEMVPWDLAQTRHLERSGAFAQLLEQHLRERVPLASK